MFKLPEYHHPDFTESRFVNAPDARFAPAPADGVAPANFHFTSMFPEYFKVAGQWQLAAESRMDSCAVRPLFLYAVDADEFVVNKLLDRGSLAAKTIVTNAQDFIDHVARGLDLIH